MMRLQLLLAFAYVGIASGAHQVLLMRHCPRAPGPLKSGRFPSEFPSLDNYSQWPFPGADVWGAAANQCTPGGLAAIDSYSSQLKNILGKINRVVADNVTRTIDTAHGLAHKLAPGRAIEVNGGLFNPAKERICPKLSKREEDDCLQAQLKAVTVPPNFQQRLRALQALIGLGKAPALDAIASNVSDGKFVGGAYVSSEIIEQFNLQLASGLPMAWNKISEDELYKNYLDLHAYYFKVAHGGCAIAQHEASGVLAATIQSLLTREPGSDVFVGHDTTLLAVMGLLGLETPYPALSEGAPPLSGLLFRVDSDDLVHVEFMSPLHPRATGLFRCSAAFTHSSSKKVTISWKEFNVIVSDVIDPKCVREDTLLV